MNIKHAALWGIFLGLWVSLGTQILTWAGLGLTNWFVALTYLSVVAFVLIGLKNLDRATETQLNYLNSAVWVLVAILVSRYVFQFYMYLYTNYVEPDWVDKVADMWTTQLAEANQTEATIEKMITGLRKSFETIPMFTIEIVKYGISQFILGFLVASGYVFSTKRRKVE